MAPCSRRRDDSCAERGVEVWGDDEAVSNLLDFAADGQVERRQPDLALLCDPMLPCQVGIAVDPDVAPCRLVVARRSGGDRSGGLGPAGADALDRFRDDPIVLGC